MTHKNTAKKERKTYFHFNTKKRKIRKSPKVKLKERKSCFIVSYFHHQNGKVSTDGKN